jgi:chorismate-pyruvate lyase
VSALLEPLARFYQRAGDAPPPFEIITPEEMPEPARCLLVHDSDMTPTLEAYHGDTIHLRVLGRIEEPDCLSREVVLELTGTGKAVEFGAIIIDLRHFSPAARADILECQRPLGSILASHNIAHAGRPLAFLKLVSDDTIRRALGIEPGLTLYGRRNQIMRREGEMIADVVEILPPVF